MRYHLQKQRRTTRKMLV